MSKPQQPHADGIYVGAVDLNEPNRTTVPPKVHDSTASSTINTRASGKADSRLYNLYLGALHPPPP